MSVFFVRTKRSTVNLTKRMNEARVAVGAFHDCKTRAKRTRVL